MNKKISVTFIFIFIILISATLTSCAKNQEPVATQGIRDQTIESEIISRLENINPEAVPVFEQATKDMDAHNLEEAKAGFEKVLILVPDFPDAIRRLSEVWLMIGDTNQSIKYARKAVELDSSPYNTVALANALLASGSEDNIAQALLYAKLAASALPNFPEAQEILLFSAIPNQDFESARIASKRLIVIDPNYAYGHYFAGLAAAEDGKWEEAEKELLIAKDLGIPSEQIEVVLADGVRAKARTYRFLRYAGTLFVIWAIFEGLLTLIAWVAGNKALKSIQKSVEDFTPLQEISEFTIPSFYKNMLNILALSYAITGPLLMLSAIVVLIAGIILAVLNYINFSTVLWMTIPSSFILITALILLLTNNKKRIVYELMRSLAEPLWNLAIDTANQIGAEPIDTMYIKPDATFLLEKEEKNSKSEEKNALFMGLSALSGMTQAQFCALLADEYALALDVDDSWSNFGLSFLSYFREQLINMQEGNQNHFYNPAWLTMRFIFIIYSRIAKAVTWQHIINSDLIAGSLFGGEHLKNALIHVLRQKLSYDEFLLPLAKTKLGKGQNIRNIYTEKLQITDNDKKRLSAKMKQVSRKPQPPFEDYPPLQARVSLLKKIGGEGIFNSSTEPIAKLISNFDILQIRMTENLRGKKSNKKQ